MDSDSHTLRLKNTLASDPKDASLEISLTAGAIHVINQALGSAQEQFFWNMYRVSHERLTATQRLANFQFEKLSERFSANFSSHGNIPFTQWLNVPALIQHKRLLGDIFPIGQRLSSLGSNNQNSKCSHCGAQRIEVTPSALAAFLIDHYRDSLCYVEAPINLSAVQKSQRAILESRFLQFGRLRVDETLLDLDDPDNPVEFSELFESRKTGISVVVDALRVEESSRRRIEQSLEEAFRLSNGKVIITETSHKQFSLTAVQPGSLCTKCHSLQQSLQQEPSQGLDPEASLMEVLSRILQEIPNFPQHELEFLEQTQLLFERFEIGHIEINRTLHSLSLGISSRVIIAKFCLCSAPGLAQVLYLPFGGVHPLEYEKVLSAMVASQRSDSFTILIEPSLAMRGVQLPDGVIPLENNSTPAHSASVVFPTVKPSPKGMRDECFTENTSLSEKVAIGKKSLVAISSLSGGVLEELSAGHVFRLLDSLTAIEPQTINQTMSQIDMNDSFKVETISQRNEKVRPHRSVAHEIGLLPELCKFYAALPWSKLHGLSAKDFRFGERTVNNCEHCKGLGTEVKIYPCGTAQRRSCSLCDGFGFPPKVLGSLYKSCSIADILKFHLEQSLDLFSFLKGWKVLHKLVHRLGLGQLELGWPVCSLGPHQKMRLKLLVALAHKKPDIIMLEYPSIGMRPEEASVFGKLLRELAEEGRAIVVIDNNPYLTSYADDIVELGQLD